MRKPHENTARQEKLTWPLPAGTSRALTFTGAKQRLFGLFLAVGALLAQPLMAASPAPIDLQSCSNFTILGSTGVSTDGGGGIINGDVGLSPATGTAITNLNAAQVNGTIYAVDVAGPAGSVMAPALLNQAHLHLTDAYNDAAGRNLNQITKAGNIGSTTLAPGLYWSAGSLQITGDLTLDAGAEGANAIWIFQMGSTLDTAAGAPGLPGSRVIMAGGGLAKNVFWQVGSSATLGTYSIFKGTILANVSITMGVGAVTEGRALARTGAVVFNGGGTGSLPDHTSGLDLDANDSSGTIGADYATTFSAGVVPVVPVAMSDPVDATVTNSDYPDLVSLTITGAGIVDGADEIVTIGGVPYPQNVDKTATATKGATTFQIAFLTATKVFTITNNAGGKMPITDVHSLLRDMTYSNTKVAPTAGLRTFTSKVNDSVVDSNNAVASITVAYPPAIDLDANDSGGTLGANYAKTFNVGGAAVAMSDAADATVTDVDSLTMTSLTITGAGIVDGIDEVVTIGGVDYPQNADKTTATVVKGGTTFQIAFLTATKIFTITRNGGGGMPLLDLNDLLQDMMYRNTKLAPAAGIRTFTCKVNDGVSDSNNAVATITVAYPPAIDLDANDSNGTIGVNYATTFNAGGAPAPLSDVLDATVTDPDSLTMASLTITGAGIVDGIDEVVTIGGVAYPQNADKTTATVIKGATTFQIAFLTATKVFTITRNGGGAMPVADLNSLLRDLTFQDAKATPTLGVRTFVCTVNDGLLDSNPATATITVIPVLTVVNGTGSGAFAATTTHAIAATVPPGQVFVAWTGTVADLAALADPAAAATTATMPNANVTVTATFAAAPPATFTLTVVGGSGGGSYVLGALVPVAVAVIPPGKVFDAWTGTVQAVGTLADPVSGATIATMPAANITITATYKDAPVNTFALTVVNGTGSGAYIVGAVVPIIATIPVGKVFSTWAGDIVHLGNAAQASTNATMPAANITVTALFINAPINTYTLTVVNGTGGGSYAAGTVVPVTAVSVPAGKVFSTWTGDIGNLADAALATTNATMPAANITIAALFNFEPPWYPRIPWTPVVNNNVVPPADYEWYNLQIWNGVPEAAGVNQVIETNVPRAEVAPEREYLLVGSDGLEPGLYYWRYRTWVPETDTYGAWIPAVGGHPQTIDYRNPPVNATNDPVIPSGLVCTSPNPGPTGNFNLEFLANNAQGYELEITGALPQNNLSQRVYFMPGDDRSVPFNVVTQRTITLVGADVCTWRVRGFNPFSDSAWSVGPAITVNATPGNVVPLPNAPDYTHMRPSDGWWVVADPVTNTASIIFEWEPVAGAAGYVMLLSSTEGAPVLYYVDIGNTTHWPLDSTTGGRVTLPAGNYLWSLIAYNDNGPNGRQYGTWNRSGRGTESPVFFQVIENLTTPTVHGAVRNAATATISWAGGAVTSVDVLLFYPGAAGWVAATNQPVTPTVANTGTVPIAWGPGVTNYLLLTGRTAAGVVGPRSRLFILP